MYVTVVEVVSSCSTLQDVHLVEISMYTVISGNHDEPICYY